MSEPEAKEEPKSWHEYPELQGTQLGSLLTDLREAILNRQEAQEREKAIRELVAPILQEKLPAVTILAVDLEARWYPPSESLKLDKAKLVAAGVTPDQLKAGMKKSQKKGYLKAQLKNSPSDESTSDEPDAG